MLNDVRYAVRSLLKAKAWTLVIVVSLALGIGANAAIFSVLRGVVLQTVPVRDPQGLVRLRSIGRNDMSNNSSGYGWLPKDTRATFSYPMYQALRANNQTMTDLFACAPFGRVNVVADGHAEIANSFIATGNYYQVIGVSASRGRVFTPEDDRAGAPPVAVISDRYWLARFGGDPKALGQIVRVNDVPVTIVGVTPRSFTGIQTASADPPDVSFPMALDEVIGNSSLRLGDATWWWLQIVGRAKPGMTAAHVQANLESVFANAAREGMVTHLASLSDRERGLSRNQSRTHVPQLAVEPAAHGVYDAGPDERRAVTILGVIVVLVLLLVCANVANLLLSRAAARRKELAVRLSLGATRRRLIRQLLTESVLLALIGAAFGIVAAYWCLPLLPQIGGRPNVLAWTVMGFTLAVACTAGIVFGIAPALRATSVGAGAAMKEDSRSVLGTRSLMTKALLVVQVALSLVLLVGAGLFLRTVQNLRHVEIGFDPSNLMLFRVNPQLNRYDAAKAFALYEQMLERIQAAPGVRAVALSQLSLLSGSVNSTGIFVQGRSYPRDLRQMPDDQYTINRVVVSASFFETLRMPLSAGRPFTDRDDAGAPNVALVNEAAQRRFFPNENPIGRHFGTNPEESSKLEIVGIVRDSKYNNLREAAPPTMYVPYLQTGNGSAFPATFEVRTAGDPSAAVGSMREIVRQIDPNLPITNVSTQLDQIEQRFEQERIFANACAWFGGLAMALACIGLFGLMSFNVERRTKEIGVRMALGASGGRVLRHVMVESMALVAIGVAVGTAAAIAASRLVGTLLFGLSPTDVPTIAAAAAIMVIVSACASLLPARRASRVDPMVALRVD